MSKVQAGSSVRSGIYYE